MGLFLAYKFYINYLGEGIVVVYNRLTDLIYLPKVIMYTHSGIITTTTLGYNFWIRYYLIITSIIRTK